MGIIKAAKLVYDYMKYGEEGQEPEVNRAIDQVDLDVEEGQFIAILGHNGSGKSTLAKHINALLVPTEGTLWVDQMDTSEAEDIWKIRQKAGMVFQNPDNQIIGNVVEEDVGFGPENLGVPTDDIWKRVDESLKAVGMTAYRRQSPNKLSGGQKQRVAFAGVMVDDVDILLLDEPLANLDPATGKTAIDLVDRIHKELDKTVIIIEHRLEDVLYRHVDRVILVSEGRIVADMTPDELMASDVLRQHGIREPLYVTAMKHAGIRVTEDMHAGYLDTLDIGRVAPMLLAWDEEAKDMAQSTLGDEILSLDHVSFQYTKKRRIIQDVSFSVRAGEMVSIVGTNGAGKSTIAKLICGFVREDEGDILFEGSSMKELTIRERADLIGYVMQNPNQMICKPMIFDEVALGLRLRGVPEEEIRERVERALKICGLYEFREWPVAALSFGQKKRVTIASILVLEPRILILDEPTAGQDYKHYTDIMEFLRSLNSLGITIIMITHDMHLMLEYTTHAIVMGGQKIGDSSAVDILTDERIAEAANLKLTSLYELAVRCGIREPQGFVQHFIDHERREERSEGKTL